MWLLEKTVGHKHPCKSDMEALASVPPQTCLFHVSYGRPSPSRASSTGFLPSLTLPHGEVINATDACSALHDSSPRQKETQSAWDDLACRDSLAALLDTPALGTTVGYSLHRKATLLPGQKPSQLLASETCWALMSSESQSPCELVPIFSKARNAAVQCRINNSSKCSNCHGPRTIGGPAVFYNKSYLLHYM